MNGTFTRRGQPLLALILLLGAWVSARAVMWEPKATPDIHPYIATAPLFDTGARRGLEDALTPGEGEDEQAPLAPAPMSVPRSSPELRGLVRFEPYGEVPSTYPDVQADQVAPQPVPRHAQRDNFNASFAGQDGFTTQSLPPAPVPVASPATPAFKPVPANVVVGHQLLWMAALARVPMPASLMTAAAQGDQRLAATTPAASAGPKRWSADGWILWRRGSTGASSGALLTPSYGASQAGAVVRYRLAPSSALRPAAYLRTTAALNGSSEREAALGLQLRPIRGLPIALAGEARVTAVPGRTFVRPAVFAVTELAPFALPLGLRGEVYGQAGYVGGNFATGFADGQMRVDRRLLGIGKGDLRLGGGVWGGVQKGASRVDAGPTLTLGRPLGGSGSIRLAADWRFRVAGKAAPGSGPAVTLSAGF